VSSSGRAISLGLATLVSVFAVIQDLVGVYWLSIAMALGSLGLMLEWLAARAKARSKRIEEEWPIVIESLESAAQSGLGLYESIRDLAESKHLLVARDFAWLCSACDSGVTLDAALIALKSRFGLASSDLTIETLRLVNDAGGGGYQQALQLQAKSIRERTRLFEQVTAKQGWVVGTAKVAVASPWIIVTLLATRPENLQVYNSAGGQLLLASGLLASFIAIRLISLIGRIDISGRVFQ
jgi:tight adherence protein B